MASIADLLGITWDTPASDAPAGQVEYTLTWHAKQQAKTKGLDVVAVLAAANTPAHTYPNGRFPGQWRHILGDICAVVDPAKGHVITVYANVVETDLRADQRTGDAAAEALAYDQARRTA
jgi:hypothetical protein